MMKKPKGDLINSFDNVVRFNNFNISKKHQNILVIKLIMVW